MDSVHIEQILNNWKSNKDSIAELFRKRKKAEAKPLVADYSHALVSFLLALNEQNVEEDEKCGIECLNGLDSKPVNIEERLQFVFQSPDNYHSFIQLNQLYEEVEKMFAKKQMMMKKK